MHYSNLSRKGKDFGKILALFPAKAHPASQPANRAFGALQIALGTINPPKLDLGRISASNPNRTKRAQTALAARATPAKRSPQGPLRVGEKALRPSPPPQGGEPHRAFASPCGPTARGVKSLNRCSQAPAQSAMRARPTNRDGSAARAETDSKARPLGRSRPSSQIEPTEALPKVWLRLENRQNEWADAYSSWRARMPKRCLPIRPMLFCREKRFEPPKLGFDFLISTYCLSCYILIFERDCLIKFLVERMACFNSLHRAFCENWSCFQKNHFRQYENKSLMHASVGL